MGFAPWEAHPRKLTWATRHQVAYARGQALADLKHLGGGLANDARCPGDKPLGEAGEPRLVQPPDGLRNDACRSTGSTASRQVALSMMQPALSCLKGGEALDDDEDARGAKPMH